MKSAYPIILTPDQGMYLVSVPDLHINTEGTSIENAIEMAADAISLWGMSVEDAGKPIPAPSTELPKCADVEVSTFVLVDFEAYRRANDMRTVRKNVTIKGYLNDMAEKAGINFSAVLQEGLKRELNLQ